jgi:glycosyltransferase involved in cell wall biosynthesis
MKITFLLTWADAMGGTERAVFSQAEYLTARHDVEILSVFRSREDLFFDTAVPVRFLVDQTGPVPRPVRASSLDETACRALAASPSRLIEPRWEAAFHRLSDIEVEHALRDLDSDIIVSTTPALMAVATTLTPSRVIKVHQEHRTSELRGATGDPLFQFAPRLDALVLLNERTLDWFAGTLGDCAPHLEAIVNAMPAGFRPRSTRRTRTVAMATRLTAEKQVDHAIAAFALVATAHPDWVLRIFGDGPLLARLRRQVIGLELHDHVLFLGPTATMAEEWAKSSLALLTSRAEAFPLVLLEAHAAGVPAISYDCPTGPAEIIQHGHNGFLVGEEDIAGLASAIITLIEDEALLDSFGEAALRSAARFDTETVMPRWERLYSALLDERDDPARTARTADRVAVWTARTGGSGFAAAVAPSARRLSDADEKEHEARIGAASPDLVRAGGRLARLTDALMPGDVLRTNLETVADALERRGVRYLLLRDHAPRHRVVVLAEQRPAALAAVAEACAERAVYAETLRPGGMVAGVTLAALVRPDARDIAGIRVFEPFVTLTRTLNYGPAYGCDLEFWEESPDGQDWVPPQRTLIGDTVPKGAMTPGTTTIGGRDYPCLEALNTVLTSDIDFPIDVVYTWVDGDEPGWLERKNATLAGMGLLPVDAAAGAVRFRSRDELRYSLRSLEMFAPWVRHIWIVTDDQVPSWLDTTHPKITMVTHKEIFGDRGSLPTFNSHAIESQLHHIEGLSEHFLYLNDDIFLGRPLEPSVFFHPSGLAKFFSSPTSVPLTPIAADDDFHFSAGKNNRRLIESAFGHTLTHAFLHAPHPLRRSVLAELQERFPDEVAQTASSQVRAVTDLAIASSLHHYYGYFTGRAVPDTIRCTYVNIGDEAAHPRLTQILTRRFYDAICLNDAYDGEVPADEQELVIHAFLESYFPVPSTFEADRPRKSILVQSPRLR